VHLNAQYVILAESKFRRKEVNVNLFFVFNRVLTRISSKYHFSRKKRKNVVIVLLTAIGTFVVAESGYIK